MHLSTRHAVHDPTEENIPVERPVFEDAALSAVVFTAGVTVIVVTLVAMLLM